MSRMLLGLFVCALSLGWGRVWGLCNPNNSTGGPQIASVTDGNSGTGPFCFGDRIVIDGSGFTPSSINTNVEVELDPGSGNGNRITLSGAALVVSTSSQIQFDLPGLVFPNNCTPPCDVTISVITGSGAGNKDCTTISVNPTVPSSLSYPDTVCYGSPALPVSSAPTGGLYSISLGNGAIDINTGGLIWAQFPANNPGPSSSYNTYTITYTPNAPCSNPVTEDIVIVNPGVPDWTYPQFIYCVDGSVGVQPFDNDSTGLPFSQVFDPNNSVITRLQGNGMAFFEQPGRGAIDLTYSDPGIYEVKFETTDLNCPETIADTIKLYSNNTTFFYPGNPYCVGGSNPTPIALDPFASFSSLTATLVDTSGQIDLSSTPPGNHAIKLTLSGCMDSATQTITVLDTGGANFNYGSPTAGFCLDGADPIVVNQPVVQGGTYTCADSRLVLDSQTGTIDLVTMSNNGNITATTTFRVVYTTPSSTFCPDAHIERLTIIPNDGESFTNLPATLCQSNLSSFFIQTGGSLGNFSVTPLGLDLTTSGIVNVANSVPGLYTVSFTTTDTCPETITGTVEVIAPRISFFQYPDSQLCKSGPANVLPILGPGTTTGGTFSCANSNLVLVDSTGAIDMQNSPAGQYTVQYKTPGPCPDSTTQTIEIFAIDNNAFQNTSDTLCTDVVTPLDLDMNGNNNGLFSAAPTGLALIDSTGEIDPGNSTPGLYQVIFTGSYACPLPDTAQVLVADRDIATFSYPDTFACKNLLDSLPASFAPGFAFGGQFTHGLGLALTNRGTIQMGPSTANAYSIQYASPGACPATDSFEIELLDPAPNVFITGGGAFCSEAPDLDLAVQDSNGMFAASPGGLNMNPTNGVVNFPGSTPGQYILTFTSATRCVEPIRDSLEIFQTDNAAFGYVDSALCNTGNTIYYAILDSGATTGGIYSSDSLNVDSLTGAFDAQIAPTGTDFDVTYRTRGICPDTHTIAIDIVGPPNGSFNYAAVEYCGLDSLEITPSSTNLMGGTFFSTPSGVNFSDNILGTIDVPNSAPGLYTIRYTNSSSGQSSCVSNLSQILEILPIDTSLSLSISGTDFCKNGVDPTLVPSDPNGFFRVVEPGLSLVAGGKIDLSNSNKGTYHIVYESLDACTRPDTIEVSILDINDAFFQYRASSYCLEGSPPSADTVTYPGFFSSPDPGMVVSDPVTGEIDLSNSQEGRFWLVYQTTGSCPDKDSTELNLLLPPNPAIDTFGYRNEICQGGVYRLSLSGFPLSTSSISFSLDQDSVVLLNSPTLSLDDSQYNLSRGIHFITYCVEDNLTQCETCRDEIFFVNPTPQITGNFDENIKPSGTPVTFLITSDVNQTTVNWRLFPVFNLRDTLLQDSTLIDIAGTEYPITPTITPYLLNSASELGIQLWGSSGACKGDTVQYAFTRMGVDDENPSLFFPEVITPNGDGYNDIWEIRWTEDENPADYRVTIYNDYGGVMAEYADLLTARSFGNKKIPNGVYWFVVKRQDGTLITRDGLTVIGNP